MTRRLTTLALLALAAMLTRGRLWSFERSTFCVYLGSDEPVLVLKLKGIP